MSNGNFISDLSEVLEQYNYKLKGLEIDNVDKIARLYIMAEREIEE